MIQKERQRFVGIVKKRLYDSKKLAVYNSAKEAGLDEEYLSELLKLATKKLFQGNVLWKFLKRTFDIDVQNIFTGRLVTETVDHNLITTRGKQLIIDLIGGLETDPAKYLAIGSGTTSPVAGNTALETEITSDGGERGLATVSHVTTDTTYDTIQLSKTYTATGSITPSEEGIFDDASAGNMLARNVFPALPLSATDLLEIIHQVKAEV